MLIDRSFQNIVGVMNAQKKILIIEDETTLRNLFVERLKELSYTIFSAPDGKTALKICEESKPDLLLLDINLPDILGIDIVEILKKNTATYGNPGIFVVTGISYSIQDAETLWLKEFKVNAFFTKPFEFNELIEKIEQFLK